METTRLLGKMLRGRFKDAKYAVVEALEKGKKKGEKILDDLDLHPEDMGDFLKELWTDFSGIMDDATKGVIAAGLKKASINQKIKFVEPLSAEDRQKLADISPEMKVIVSYCTDRITERSKMKFRKIKTVKDYADIAFALGLGIYNGEYPDDAPVIAIERKEKGSGNLMIDILLEKGDYGKSMVRIGSFFATQLYK